jgi:DNA-binding Lrp family transcriptional regulator
VSTNVLKVVIFAREKSPESSAAESLSKVEGITEAFEVTGKDDIIAMAEVLSGDELKWLENHLRSEPSIESFQMVVVKAERKK